VVNFLVFSLEWQDGGRRVGPGLRSPNRLDAPKIYGDAGESEEVYISELQLLVDFCFAEAHRGQYTRFLVLNSLGEKSKKQLQWQSFVQSASRVRL
jgi:hypothetical protein